MTSPLRTLLVEPDRAGTFYLRASDLPALRRAATDVGFRCAVADLHDCRGHAAVHAVLRAAFAIPADRATDWDGLADALVDLHWLAAEGHLLAVENAGTLLRASDAGLTALVTLLDDVADAWRARGVPFWTFIALPDDEFAAIRA